MKVLMTADAIGGVWQYSLELARGLTRQGLSVILAVLGPRPSAVQHEQARSLAGATLVESDFALEWMQDPWRDVDASAAWVRSLAREHAVDLVHLNGYSQAAANWDCPVITVAHSCVSSWWRAVHCEPAGPEWNEYRRRVSAGLAASDQVVAPTHSMALALDGEYGFAETRTRVIHNFSRAPRNIRGEKQMFCLAAGRVWDKAKNFGVLEDVAAELPCPLEVAGPHLDPQTGEPLSSSLRLLGAVRHSRLWDRMRQAALFLHPALYEPFGLAVLEAARCRCCLVLSDIQSLRELWDGAAIFVNPRDPGAWRTEIRRLAACPSTRKHFGALALERSTRYAASASVSAYLDLYSSLTKTKTRKGVAA